MKRVVFATLWASVAAHAPALAQQAAPPASVSDPAALGETLAQAVASALDSNPDYAARKKQRQQADESVKQARAGYLPTVSVTGSYTYASTNSDRASFFNPDGTSTTAAAGLRVVQPLYQGGAMTGRYKQARAGAEAAEAQLVSAAQQLVLDVVTAFVDVRRAEEEVLIRQNNVRVLKKQLQAANDRFRVGEVTRTDVAQAEARASAADANLSVTMANRETVRAGYAELVGHVAPSLAAPPPPPALPASLDGALAIALKSNPNLVASRAAERAADAAVSVARSGLRPRVSIVGSAGLQQTELSGSFRDDDASISAQVSIPLYQGGLASSQTRSAKLDADRARLETLRLERAVTSGVTQAWHQHQASLQAIEASKVRVSAAKVAFEGAEQELAVGLRTTLDVLDQEQEYLAARLGLVDAERQAYVAAHALLAAMGQLSGELITGQRP